MTMPFITLPDIGLRINLVNVNYIEEQANGAIAVHFNDEGCPEVIEGDAATRIKIFWDSVAEILSWNTDSASAPGRDFDLGDKQDSGDTVKPPETP